MDIKYSLFVIPAKRRCFTQIWRYLEFAITKILKLNLNGYITREQKSIYMDHQQFHILMGQSLKANKSNLHLATFQNVEGANKCISSGCWNLWQGEPHLATRLCVYLPNWMGIKWTNWSHLYALLRSIFTQTIYLWETRQIPGWTRTE